MFVVGSGGSHSVAQYVSYTLNRGSQNCFAIPIYPLDYIRLARRTDVLIVVSYSGKTTDCQHAIALAKRLNVGKIGLLTGVSHPLLGKSLRSELQDSVLSFSPASGHIERGFVSVLGTVGLCAAWCAALLKDRLRVLELLQPYQVMSPIRKEIREQAELLTSRLDPGLISDGHSDDQATPAVSPARLAMSVFGSGCAVPAIHDLESKITEGNLGWVRLHDEKDFSHGRFMSVLSLDHANEPALLFRSAESSSYTDKLERVLRSRSKEGVAKTAMISSSSDGAVGALDLLVKTQLLVRELAALLKVDISRPGYDKIPRHGLSLYKWKDRL